MNRNAFIIFLVLGLLVTNFYWAIDKYRTNNREAYNDTLRCELSKMAYCNKTFPIGISSNKFKLIVKNEKLTFSDLKSRGNGETFYNIREVFTKCPLSGRPYCGFEFVFQKGKLKEIVAGYPCH